jgi:beta-phosphoglucomutase-like phosphatase (HAD superfamily)
VVVEDSPLGVAAANVAGMKVFGFAAMTDPAKLTTATQVFHKMADLPELIHQA